MPLLTLGEVARELALSERTVHRLVKRGLPRIRLGRSVRFDPERVREWVSEHESRAGAASVGMGRHERGGRHAVCDRLDVLCSSRAAGGGRR